MPHCNCHYNYYSYSYYYYVGFLFCVNFCVSPITKNTLVPPIDWLIPICKYSSTNTTTKTTTQNKTFPVRTQYTHKHTPTHIIVINWMSDFPSLPVSISQQGHPKFLCCSVHSYYTHTPCPFYFLSSLSRLQNHPNNINLTGTGFWAERKKFEILHPKTYTTHDQKCSKFSHLPYTKHNTTYIYVYYELIFKWLYLCRRLHTYLYYYIFSYCLKRFLFSYE